jgi:hypothetical protein
MCDEEADDVDVRRRQSYHPDGFEIRLSKQFVESMRRGNRGGDELPVSGDVKRKCLMIQPYRRGGRPRLRALEDEPAQEFSIARFAVPR